MQSETTDFKKPMSLQQVITVFDKRLLVLEKAIIENKTPVESKNVSVNNELHMEQTNTLIETLREDLKVTLTEQSKEFDYRTNVLATEITELKDIVMKLQSYTLEVNKTLLEEREHFFSETETSIQIQSDELLNDDDLEVIDNDENIAIELVESDGVQEEDVQEEEVAIEDATQADKVALEDATQEEEVALEDATQEEVVVHEDAVQEEESDEDDHTVPVQA